MKFASLMAPARVGLKDSSQSSHFTPSLDSGWHGFLAANTSQGG